LIYSRIYKKPQLGIFSFSSPAASGSASFPYGVKAEGLSLRLGEEEMREGDKIDIIPLTWSFYTTAILF